MEAELAARARGLAAVLADAEALAGALAPEQLAWRPAPGRWSVADCVNHLNVTVSKYLPRIDAMLAQGRAEGRTARGPFRHPWTGNWFVRMLEPPPRRRLRVPGVFAPLPGAAPDAQLAEFRALRAELLGRVAQADGLDLAALRTASPAARYLVLSLGQCFAALAAHDRRHLWQARRVVEHPDFPAGPSAR
jgi:hypothetical protein